MRGPVLVVGACVRAWSRGRGSRCGGGEDRNVWRLLWSEAWGGACEMTVRALNVWQLGTRH